MKKELRIPGTMYVINAETQAVARLPKRYPVAVDKGLVRLYMGPKRHKFTPGYLLACAQSGLTPVPSSRVCRKPARRVDGKPWSLIKRLWSDNGGKEFNYYVNVIPHVPVLELRTGLEAQGITWHDPIMLGIDAPLVGRAA